MYPSTVLHRVNKVTEGKRLVAVGWVTSHVRNEEYRNVLYNVAQVLAQIYEKDGGSMPYIKLTQIYNNLMRLWSE
jgi:PKHD-type hydroxylase